MPSVNVFEKIDEENSKKLKKPLEIRFLWVYNGQRLCALTKKMHFVNMQFIKMQKNE